MSKRRRAHRKPGIARYIAVGLAVGAVALLLIFVARRPADGDRGLLPDSEMAFSVPDHVGQSAQSFTAVGVDGRPYMVTPGDGRPKAIVFYMGFR